mgnify:CR=1 FL=1
MEAKLVTVNELLNIDITGKVVVFPTDTVYGVGCKVDDIEAIHKIYELKERDYSKPLAILTPSTDITKYVSSITIEAQDLMNKYWPGALTVIVKKSELINDLITSNKDTVGFRMPNSKVALKILNKFGIMPTTSINISGSLPLNDIDEIIKQFKNKIDYIVTDREITSKVSSTVIDATTKDIIVLRQGDIKIK